VTWAVDKTCVVVTGSAGEGTPTTAVEKTRVVVTSSDGGATPPVTLT
jgi:hypothetical protein